MLSRKIRIDSFISDEEKEEIYQQLLKEIEKFSKIDSANEEEMKKYLKFKKNSYKSYEFLRFIDGLENVNVITEENRIYFTKMFTLNKEEKLLVLYKDLTCEIFTYDKKLREIKLFKKFVIMIEDEFISMKYVTGVNVLIGYTENTINVFDLLNCNKLVLPLDTVKKLDEVLDSLLK